jgi:hypothetical protein
MSYSDVYRSTHLDTQMWSFSIVKCLSIYSIHTLTNEPYNNIFPPHPMKIFLNGTPFTSENTFPYPHANILKETLYE